MIAPSPDVDAPELGVTGELLNESEVLVGAHVTDWAATCTVIVIALLMADAYIESAATLEVTVQEPAAEPVRVEFATEQLDVPEATL